jgi:hypothetical protein
MPDKRHNAAAHREAIELILQGNFAPAHPHANFRLIFAFLPQTHRLPHCRSNGNAIRLEPVSLLDPPAFRSIL